MKYTQVLVIGLLLSPFLSACASSDTIVQESTTTSNSSSAVMIAAISSSSSSSVSNDSMGPKPLDQTPHDEMYVNKDFGFSLRYPLHFAATHATGKMEAPGGYVYQ